MTTKLNKIRQATYGKVVLWGVRVTTVVIGTPRRHVAVNNVINAVITPMVAQQCILSFVALPTLLQTRGQTLLSSCKVADIFFRTFSKSGVSWQNSVKSPIPNFTKIRPLGDGQTATTKLVGAFSDLGERRLKILAIICVFPLSLKNDTMYFRS
jgi:hypothetical protein